MDAMKRKNRLLRIAVVVLFCALATGAAMSGQDKGQPVPGFGSGIVPVKLTDDVVKVVQHSEWRVGQHGDWKVGVQGVVETRPPMPPSLAVNQRYALQWDRETVDVVTLRELHASGWARVDGQGGERWVNLSLVRAIAVAR
jgi:hypothetical protein